MGFVRNIFVVFIVFSKGIALSQTILPETLYKDLLYLSSDSLKGRLTGSLEEQKSAEYIIDRLTEIGIQPKGKEGFLHPFSYSLSSHTMHQDTLNPIRGIAHNVVGYIDNQAQYTVVLGAHYDHLGLGEIASMGNKGLIHNGADDNASGVAGILSLAQYFKQNAIQEHYNFLFIFFSGEELGLLGSKAWCDDPSISLSNIHYMINLDMIGRLDSIDKKLFISGLGTSTVFNSLIDSLGTDLKIQKDSSGLGPSDHASFYLKNIPVLYFFTGQHLDYHKETDDMEALNIFGEQEVLQYVVQIIHTLDTKEKLTFLPTRNKSSNLQKAFKVTLGIMPDYSFEGKGVRIADVLHNRPAFHAGLQRNDVVLSVDRFDIQNMNDYMEALSTIEKGTKTTVKIRRDQQFLELNINFKK